VILANPAHLGAKVVGLDVDRDAVRLHHPVQLVTDLVRHALLDTEATGDDTDEPGQLADPDDALVGHVADVDVAEERQGVVLAQGEERDRALDDLGDLAVGPAAAFGRERGEQLGIALIAAVSRSSPRAVRISDR
jgi:hypothetical protein